MLKRQRNRGGSLVRIVHGIHYLQTGNARYTLSLYDEGIRGTGDRFDYIVAWQKGEEEKETLFNDSLYV